MRETTSATRARDRRGKEHQRRQGHRRRRSAHGDVQRQRGRVHEGRGDRRDRRLAARVRHDQGIGEDPDGDRRPAAGHDVGAERHRVEHDSEEEGLDDLVEEAQVEQLLGREHFPVRDPGHREREAHAPEHGEQPQDRHAGSGVERRDDAVHDGEEDRGRGADERDGGQTSGARGEKVRPEASRRGRRRLPRERRFRGSSSFECAAS